MKLTQNDLAFFKELSKTETGKYLADFLKRVVDYAYDSRSWQEKDTKESAGQAARLIREELLERIRPENAAGTHKNQFE